MRIKEGEGRGENGGKEGNLINVFIEGLLLPYLMGTLSRKGRERGGGLFLLPFLEKG